MDNAVTVSGLTPPHFPVAQADQPADSLQFAADQEIHREGGGVPAARHQPAEGASTGGLLVQVERLGVELGGNRLDHLGLDSQSAGPESLPDGRSS
jgi:hypothetical protein